MRSGVYRQEKGTKLFFGLLLADLPIHYARDE